LLKQQANIADQQVVNNGTMNTGSCAHGTKNADKPNEQLSEVKHEKGDSGTTASPKVADTKSPAVEKINRCKNPKRKS